MGYKAPSLQELKKLATTLREAYKGTNQHRLHFLAILQNLASDPQLDFDDHDAFKILMGAYLFEMQVIGKEYKWYSPDRSDMYYHIRNGLGMDQNTEPCDTDTFIYITAFYNYVEKRAHKEFTQNTFWCTNQALSKDILKGIEILLSRQYPQVHSLLTALPRYQNLVDNMTDMTIRYNRLSPPKYWGWSGNAHIEQSTFVDFISAYCNEYYAQKPDADQDTLEAAVPYFLRLGALVYVMSELEKECALSSSAKRSKLHQLCAEAANIKLTTDVSLQERGIWLFQLTQELNSIIANRQDFIARFQEQLNKSNSNIRNVSLWLTENLSKVHAQLASCHLEVVQPNSIQASATSAVGGAASYGMRTAIRTTTGYTFPTTTSLIIRGAAAGATGFAVFGPGGALLGVSISLLKNIGSVIVSSLLVKLLSKMGNTVAGGAAGVIIMPVNATRTGIMNLYRKYKGYQDFNPQELRKNDEFLDALMSLPDDVFPNEHKENLQRTMMPLASNH